MRKLTPKQQRFVKEYMVDLNATQSAERAGYSKRTAYSIGQRLLKNVEVQKSIQTQQQELSKKIGNKAADIVELHRKIAFADVTSAFENGVALSPHLIPEDLKIAVKQVRMIKRSDGSVIYEYKFWDKNKAADALSKYSGLYLKDNSQKDDVQNVIDKITTKAEELLISLGYDGGDNEQ